MASAWAARPFSGVSGAGASGMGPCARRPEHVSSAPGQAGL